MHEVDDVVVLYFAEICVGGCVLVYYHLPQLVGLHLVDRLKPLYRGSVVADDRPQGRHIIGLIDFLEFPGLNRLIKEVDFFIIVIEIAVRLNMVEEQRITRA